VIAHHKNQLRRHFKAQRLALPESIQQQAAEDLVHQFWQQYQMNPLADITQLRIGFYMAILGEVSTFLLLQDCLKRGISCFLPVIPEDPHEKQLHYVEVFADSEFSIGAFGTKTPTIGKTESASSLTHLLVPALAVTKAGARLGFGAGYFDATIHATRSLMTAPPQCWGVVYAFQCVDDLPQASWDEPLDAVLCVADH